MFEVWLLRFIFESCLWAVLVDLRKLGPASSTEIQVLQVEAETMQMKKVHRVEEGVGEGMQSETFENGLDFGIHLKML